MAFHTDESFAGIIAALPRADRDFDPEDLRVFREQVEEVLFQKFDALPKGLQESEFDKWVEIKTPRSKKGGRPADTGMNTAVLALADIYERRTSKELETRDLPISDNSHLVRYLEACLRPLAGGRDQTAALAERWEGLRSIIRGESN